MLLSKPPQDYGYQEAGWQINLLRDWFQKQGVFACKNTRVKELNKLSFIYLSLMNFRYFRRLCPRVRKRHVLVILLHVFFESWGEKSDSIKAEHSLVTSIYKRFFKTMPQNAPSFVEKKVRITELVEAIGNDSSADIDVLFVDESHFLQNTIQLSVFGMG